MTTIAGVQVSDNDNDNDNGGTFPSSLSDSSFQTDAYDVAVPVADTAVHKMTGFSAAMAADIFLPVTMCFLGFVVLIIYACVWFATVNPSALSSPAMNNVVDAVFDYQFSQTILPLSTILTGLFVGSLGASVAYCACAFDPIVSQNARHFFDLNDACVVRWLVAIAAVFHLLPKLIFHGLLGSSSLLSVTLDFKVQFLAALTLTSGLSAFLMEWSLYLLDPEHVIVSPLWIYSCAACILLNSVGFLILLDNRLVFKSVVCADGECSLSILGQFASYAPVPLLCAHTWLAVCLIRYHFLKRRISSPSSDNEGNGRRHSSYSSHTEWFICALAGALVVPTVLRVVASVFYSFLSAERSPFASTFHVHFLFTTLVAAGLLALAVWVPVEGPTVSILGLYRSNGSPVDRNAAAYLEQCSEIVHHSDESSSVQSESINSYDNEDEYGDVLEDVATLRHRAHLDEALHAATLARSARYAPIKHLQSRVKTFSDSLVANVETLVTESARDTKQKGIGWWRCVKLSDPSLENAIGVSPGELEVSGRESKVQDDDDDLASMVTLCDHRMCVIKRYFYGNNVDCYFDLHGFLHLEIAPQQLQVQGCADFSDGAISSVETGNEL